MAARRGGSPPPPPPPVNLPQPAQAGPPGGGAGGAAAAQGRGAVQPHFQPEQLLYVWLEGLPTVPGFSFIQEYVEPCREAYGAAFDADRSFLIDRHDLAAGATPPLTWGVLVFRNADSAQECGMRAAVGPLVEGSSLHRPPSRVTVRRRIPARQDELDRLAAELARQQAEQGGTAVRDALADAERRRAASPQERRRSPRRRSPPPRRSPERSRQLAEAPPLPPRSLDSSGSDVPLGIQHQLAPAPARPAPPPRQPARPTPAAPPAAQAKAAPAAQKKPAAPAHTANGAVTRQPAPQPSQQQQHAAVVAPQGKAVRSPFDVDAQQPSQPPLGLVQQQQQGGQEKKKTQAADATAAKPRAPGARKAAGAKQGALEAPQAKQPRERKQRRPTQLSAQASTALASPRKGAAPAAGTSFTEPNEELRGKVRALLEQALLVAVTELERGGGEPGDGAPAPGAADAADMAARVEQALLQAHGGQTNKGYRDRARTLHSNLKAARNPDLRAHVLSGEIPAERFVQLTADELASQDLREHRQLVLAHSLRNAVLPPELAAAKSTTAAIELKQAGLLPFAASARAASQDRSFTQPQHSPAVVGLAAAGGATPGAPVVAELGAIRTSPLAPVLGAALPPGGEAGDARLPVTIAPMPAYVSSDDSEHGEPAGSLGLPGFAGTATAWDEPQRTALGGGEAAAEQLQRARTPDLARPATGPAGPLPLDEPQQHAATPDLDPGDAPRVPPALLELPAAQPQQPASSREATPDLLDDDAPVLPAQAASQPQQQWLDAQPAAGASGSRGSQRGARRRGRGGRGKHRLESRRQDSEGWERSSGASSARRQGSHHADRGQPQGHTRRQSRSPSRGERPGQAHPSSAAAKGAQPAATTQQQQQQSGGSHRSADAPREGSERSLGGTAALVPYAPLAHQTSLATHQSQAAQLELLRWQQQAQAAAPPQPHPQDPLAGAFWRGMLEWPQHSTAPHMCAAATAHAWHGPDRLAKLKLPERLVVWMSIPGDQLLPFLEGVGVPRGQACWFVLGTGASGEDGMAGCQDLSEGRVGTCLVDVAGEQVVYEDTAWTLADPRAWSLHLLAPTAEAMSFAGAGAAAAAAALGPGALLVLALPAWYGTLHWGAERALYAKMVGPPLLHSLPANLVAPHLLSMSAWQFQEHAGELRAQLLVVKPRSSKTRDVEGMGAWIRDLAGSDKCLVVPLKSLHTVDADGQRVVVAELLLMPSPDGKLQGATWEKDNGPDRGRRVFDPWQLTLG